MEFPSLGSHCFERTCNRLDFLPMKCDACSNIFCMDHFHYNQHSCQKGFQKDVQVPVCPLCNKPVPSKRGEQPDIAVGEHIDTNCQGGTNGTTNKIYTNKCSLKGCKQKELIPLNCGTCRKNYCLKHRHPTDHKCSEQPIVPPQQAAGNAAMVRAQNYLKTKKFPWLSSSSQSSSTSAQRPRPVPVTLPPTSAPVLLFQDGLTEDEALALALQKSMNETRSKNSQEEEDRLLAQALANCDQNPPSVPQQQNRDKKCCVS